MAKHSDERNFRIYLSLGSNLGERANNLLNAKNRLIELLGVSLNCSSIYETEPWGNKDLLPFFNQVVEFHCFISPMSLLNTCKQIEVELGRKKQISKEYQNRLIDIDILLMDQIQILTENLIVPHPFLKQRLFVLEPLIELANLNSDKIVLENYLFALNEIRSKKTREIVTKFKDNSMWNC